jgi:hypothetical protein
LPERTRRRGEHCEHDPGRGRSHLELVRRRCPKHCQEEDDAGHRACAIEADVLHPDEKDHGQDEKISHPTASLVAARAHDERHRDR